MVTMQESELRNDAAVAETRLPEQRGRTASADARQQTSAVLVVDPDDRMEIRLRLALADSRIIRARSASDVEAMLSAVAPGPLALVNMQRLSNAADLIRTLRAAGWQRVLALTDRGTEIKEVLAAFSAGAGGMVRVSDGGTQRQHPLDPPSRLSRREVEVVRLVADGLSNKAIGQQLSLSALTVKNHLARVGRKLGTGDRAHIVAIACRQGMILADN